MSCLPWNETYYRPMKTKMEGSARQQQNKRRHEEGDGSVEGRDILSLSF